MRRILIALIGVVTVAVPSSTSATSAKHDAPFHQSKSRSCTVEDDGFTICQSADGLDFYSSLDIG